MKNFAIVTALALSSSLVTVGITQANAVDNVVMNITPEQTTQMQREHRVERMIQRGPLSKLDLTEAQKVQIKAIMQQRLDNRLDNNLSEETCEQQKAQIKALLANNTLDTTQLDALANSHAEQAKQRFIQRIQTQHMIAQILTPEQREQLQIMQDARKNKSERRRHYRNKL